MLPAQARSSAQGTEADADANLADRLHSVAIHLLRRVRGADQESGVSPARLSLLSVLVFTGGGRTLGELAQAEQVRPPTVTKMVQALEADGFVRRRRDRDDRRVVRIFTTAKARRAIERARKERLRRLDQLLHGLTKQEAARLERALGGLERVL